MKFKDRNEFEIYVAGLAGIAGVIASSAFNNEGEEGEIYRASTHLQSQLECLTRNFEIIGDSSIEAKRDGEGCRGAGEKYALSTTAGQE